MLIRSEELIENMEKYFNNPKVLPTTMELSIDELRQRQGIVKSIEFIEKYVSAIEERESVKNKKVKS